LRAPTNRFLLPAPALAVAGLFIPPAIAAAPVAETEWFALYSDPWVNLHHVLYDPASTENAEAEDAARSEVEPGTDDGEAPRRPRRLGTGPGDLALLDGLPEAAREAWRRAVDLYRAELASRDLLFGDGMVPLRNALARGGADEARRAIDAGELTEAPAALPDALTAAMEVYRTHLWPAHDRRNREWIAAVMPRLERSGPSIAPGMVRAFGGDWPRSRSERGLRADVSVHAGWAGAYSSHHPDHVVISSTDEGHAGDASVESLFHEAGHSRALGDDLGELLATAFEAIGEEPPEALWHALLFYTAGELTRQALEADGRPGYVPYALRHQLVDRAPGWQGWYRALDTHWRPFLASRDGDEAAVRTARERALAAVAREIAGANERGE
jgi:hypothetical protein